MRKFAVIALLCLIGIALASSYAKGQETARQRQMIQQSCEADPSCTYVHIQK